MRSNSAAASHESERPEGERRSGISGNSSWSHQQRAPQPGDARPWQNPITATTPLAPARRTRLNSDQIVLLAVGIILGVAIVISAWVLREVFFQ